MSDEALEVRKRFTLNWLIQGAAQHAGMTFHHLVRDELNALHPELVWRYDQYALINLLQYWHVEARMVFGSPPRFWKQATTKQSHPFFGHPLLSRYGGTLAEAGRQRALKRCKEKDLRHSPIAFIRQALSVMDRLRVLEAPHRPRLTQLARETASAVWGIPTRRLDGELTDRIAVPSTLSARSFRDEMFLACIVGYGCVEPRRAGLTVVAKATNWQLLAKELVKGTAELICLHGLSQLSEDTYRRVLDVTDRLEFEPWMLQSGSELWRRLLASLPDDAVIARVLMDLARLPATDLESRIAAVIDRADN